MAKFYPSSRHLKVLIEALTGAISGHMQGTQWHMSDSCLHFNNFSLGFGAAMTQQD